MAFNFFALNLSVSEILCCMCAALSHLDQYVLGSVIPQAIKFAAGLHWPAPVPVLYLCGALAGSGPHCGLPEVQTPEIEDSMLRVGLAVGDWVLLDPYISCSIQTGCVLSLCIR